MGNVFVGPGVPTKNWVKEILIGDRDCVFLCFFIGIMDFFVFWFLKPN